MSKSRFAFNKPLVSALLIVVAVAGVVLVWKARGRTVRAEKSEVIKGLSAEEIVLMLENQALVEPSKTLAIVQSAETRKAFLSGLREYLALASRARREGLLDDPDIQLAVKFKRNSLLAKLYLNKLDNDQNRLYQVPKDQVDAFWRESENEREFRDEMEALQSIQKAVAENTGNPYAVADLQGDSLERTRAKWAENRIVVAMARADSQFMSQKGVDLRLRVAETGVLSAGYLNKYWKENVRVSEEEIRIYLTAHPEYDLARKRAQAETLLRRARSGDDFARLAAESSEDRGTKDKGGLYENIEPELLWPEVQQVVLKLQKGQIADQLIESKDGYHVVQLVDQHVTKDAQGVEVLKVSVRHILVQKRFEEPGNRNPDVPPPFLTPREIAQAALLFAKRKRLVDEVVKSENISLPDDFSFAVTEELKAAAAPRIEKLIKEARAGSKENATAPGPATK